MIERSQIIIKIIAFLSSLLSSSLLSLLCHKKKMAEEEQQNSKKENKKLFDAVEKGDEEVVKVLLLGNKNKQFKHLDIKTSSSKTRLNIANILIACGYWICFLGFLLIWELLWILWYLCA